MVARHGYRSPASRGNLHPLIPTPLSPVDPVKVERQLHTHRNRLVFRSWHRGTQESDLLLGSFADSCLTALDASQLDRFEALLDCSDPDLFEWILGGVEPPAEHDHDVMHLLRAYWSQLHRN